MRIQRTFWWGQARGAARGFSWSTGSLASRHKGEADAKNKTFAPREGFAAIVADFRQADTILGSYYGDVDSEATNLSQLEITLQHLTAGRLPIVIGGDFNLQAQVLANWLQVRFPLLQITQAGPTCRTRGQGKVSTIDYFLVSKTLAPIFKQIRTEDTTLKTHKPVSLTLSATDKERMVNKYEYDKPGHARVVGPLRQKEEWRADAEQSIVQRRARFLQEDQQIAWATNEQAQNPEMWGQITQAATLWHEAAAKFVPIARRQ